MWRSFFIGFLFWWGVVIVLGQNNNPSPSPTTVHTRQFLLPIMKEGMRDLLLEGEEGVTKGSIIVLRNLRCTLFSTPSRAHQATILAPSALYYVQEEQIKSDASLMATILPTLERSQNQSKAISNAIQSIVLRGEGFSLDLRTRVLNLHSEVKVTVLRYTPESLSLTVLPSKWQRIEIQCHSLRYFFDEGRLELQDDVQLQEFDENGSSVVLLHCKEMVLLRDQQKIDFEKLIIRDRIYIKSSWGILTGELGEYDVRNKKIILSGFPKILQTDSSLEGASILIYQMDETNPLFLTQGGRPYLKIEPRSHPSKISNIILPQENKK